MEIDCLEVALAYWQQTAAWEDACPQAGTVVDLGCGSGILAHDVTQAAYSVVGIDVSDAMVAIARDRAPQAEFRFSSFFSADFPTCVAVTAIGEVLNSSRISKLARIPMYPEVSGRRRSVNLSDDWICTVPKTN